MWLKPTRRPALVTLAHPRRTLPLQVLQYNGRNVLLVKSQHRSLFPSSRNLSCYVRHQQKPPSRAKGSALPLPDVLQEMEKACASHSRCGEAGAFVRSPDTPRAHACARRAA